MDGLKAVPFNGFGGAPLLLQRYGKDFDFDHAL
jgi:hypothetical protein